MTYNPIYYTVMCDSQILQGLNTHVYLFIEVELPFTHYHSGRSLI